MYYQEKIEHGLIYYCTVQNGSWRPLDASIVHDRCIKAEKRVKELSNPIYAKGGGIYTLLKEVANLSVFDQPEGLIRLQSEAEKLLKTIDNEY